jgi:methylglutaconyl-CoA hydratase
MVDQIYRCPQPVIAKVHGDCYGGAIGLIAACDVAVAAESAHFCLSEVKLGLIPATIAPYVIEAMGARTAYRYMVSAERFSAQQAQHMGLVHEVVASDKLDDATHAIVQAIVANGPNAVKEAKKLVRDMTNAIIDERLLTDTAERIATVRASSEAQEGIKAFLEKRTPSWNL